MTLMRPRPRVLHLLADWRWSGTAENLVDQCRRLRRHGHIVDIACPRTPAAYPTSFEHRARERRVEPVFDFDLRLSKVLRDVATLVEYIDREEVQILHAHDALSQYIATRASRRAQNLPFVVRSNHAAEPIRDTAFQRWLIKGRTHGWMGYSRRCLDEDARTFGIPDGHTVLVNGAVDLDRFTPPTGPRAVRAEIGLKEGDVAAGVDQALLGDPVLGEALASAMTEEPALRVVALPNESNERAPAVSQDRILRPHSRGEQGADIVRGIDFVVCPATAADKDCYSTRAALACGKPALVGHRGLLASLVDEARCGAVVDFAPRPMADGILRLVRDARLREKYSRVAAQRARELFDPEPQAGDAAELYMRLAEGV